MNQYLVTAYDYRDDQGLERRMAARPYHFETARKLKRDNHFITGGAMLDDDGRMIGSTMIVQFETPGDLEKWMDDEPYIRMKVWEKIEIKPFRVADV